MISRQDKINKGKLWQVYPDNDADEIMCEGSKSFCMKYIKENGLMRQYKRGAYRVGKLLWENDVDNSQ